MTRLQKRQWLNWFWTTVMRLSLGGAALCLGLILATITWRGVGALSWEMLTQKPEGAFYLGGGGGILNAILGSLYLAAGSTFLASLLALPLVLYVHGYLGPGRSAALIRLVLDVLWGIPSIVYGAFGFALMVAFGLRASLLAGIITLAFVILPILARTFDEIARLTPPLLREVTVSLGATRYEWVKMLVRQTIPGLFTALLLAFGRGIGDAASVLFTAGYTDNLPTSLDRPVASLPLAIFFQLSTPFPEVQARAYASAFVLTFIVLSLNVLAHVSLSYIGRHVIR